jgi:hypothetical protein
MRPVALPGVSTARLYVWLILLSPLLLVLAGVVLLLVGLAQDHDAVAVTGAVAVVAGLLLPRMQGAFEVGPSGIKGNLGSGDIASEVLRQGLDQGVTQNKAIEWALDAGGEESPSRNVADAVAQVRQQATYEAARQFVNQALTLEAEVADTITRFAQEKGWNVERGTLVEVSAGRTREIDFVIHTRGDRKLLIEVAVIRSDRGYYERAKWMAEAVATTDALAGFVVVPVGSMHGRPVDKVHIIEAPALEKNLRNYP